MHGGFDLRGNGLLGAHKPRVALQVTQFVALQLQLWVTLMDARRVQHLVANAMALGAFNGAAHEVAFAVVGCDTVTGCQDEPAGGGEDAAPGAGFQLAPDLVRAVHQWHVFVALTNRQAADAGFTMRRALVVRRAELVDAQHLGAALCKLVERGGTDSAEANHDGIKVGSGHG